MMYGSERTVDVSPAPAGRRLSGGPLRLLARLPHRIPEIATESR